MESRNISIESIKLLCQAVHSSCKSCAEKCIQDAITITQPFNDLGFNIQQNIEKWMTITFPILSILGILGNSTVIFVILRLKEMRNKYTHLFLLNMAIADLAVSIFCVNFTLLEYINGFVLHQLGLIACRLNFFLQSLSYAASVLLLFMLSIERYIAIVYPMKVRTLMSRKTQLILLVTIWLVSSIIAMPNLFIYELLNSDNSSFCHSTKSFLRRHLHLTQFITLYILPLLVMAILYCHIGYKLTKSIQMLSININITVPKIKKSVHRLSNVEFSCASTSVSYSNKRSCQRYSIPGIVDKKRRRSSSSSYVERKKIIKMLIAVVMLFAFSRLPRHIWCFIYFHRLKAARSINFGLLFPPISFFCYYLSSALNPFVYFLFSKSMRQSAKNAFCFCKTKSKYLKVGMKQKWK